MPKTRGQPPFIPPQIVPAFSPSELCTLRRVVDDAWAELEKTNGPLSPERAQLTRELLAHRVMARAAHGERDPERLKQHAVQGMSRTKRRQSH